MLNVFTLAHGRLVQEEIDPASEGGSGVPAVWVDLEAPSFEEKGWMRERFGLVIPADAVDEDIEESARFYEEDNGELHIRSDFLIDGDSAGEGQPARNVRVAFILREGVLFSVHAKTCRCSACCACARGARRR
jgi:magnesium transporter